MTRLEVPVLSDQDLHYFREGTHTTLHDKLGGHLDEEGATFAVWAPQASFVSVAGDFNGWNPDSHPLEFHPPSGTWQTSVPGLRHGDLYKFHVAKYGSGYRAFKADPFARWSEAGPNPASKLWRADFEWGDAKWLHHREHTNWQTGAISIYEVHLASWRRKPNGSVLSYREIAEPLCEHVKHTGFTHVQLLPIAGSGLAGSAGYFAPSPALGSPTDLMYLVDYLHRNGVGVILTWTPTRHNQTEEEGLHLFDGSHSYETENPPFDFDLDRGEVRSFLLSNARYWLSAYHLDGLSVAGLNLMLPHNGGLLLASQLNGNAARSSAGTVTIASHSTGRGASPGFTFMQDSAWTHQTLHYFFQDPYFRRYHHSALTGQTESISFDEAVLPLSHEEVKDGKGSLFAKMPGDEWQKFASLRLLFGYMWSRPGKKLLFMGAEFGHRGEWNGNQQLDWDLLAQENHAQLRLLVGTLNHLYLSEPALQAVQEGDHGFQWIDASDAERNVITYAMSSPEGSLLIACNFSPIPRHNYRAGVPRPGMWQEILNTDAAEFGGSGMGNFGGIEAVPIPLHGRYQSVTLTLPPLAAIYLKWTGQS